MLFSRTLFAVLLTTLLVIPMCAAEEAAVFSCPEWHSAIEMNMDALDKAKRKAADEKPEAGFSYTKAQFVVLLGVNPTAAKAALENGKGKLPKTSEGNVDLTGAVLNGFNLSGLNFDQVDFRGAEMNGANLSGSSFRHSTFYKTELEGANLNGANLSFASVSKAKLTNASLCRTKLIAADFEGANISGAYLRGAQLDMAHNLPKIVYQHAVSILEWGLAVPAE
jgi:uncharacterized protein YjbI with pentapeptide repeats